MSVQVEIPRSEAHKRERQQRGKMSIKRKRLSPPQAVSSQQSSRAGSQQVNGLYIHSSPPRVLQMNPSIIRQWLRGGDVEKLEQVVLEGQGHKLVGEYSPDPKVRAFLKTVPSYMAKMEMLHEAVNRGQLSDMQTILGEDPRSKKLALCKDNNGVGLLHKAVYYDQQPIVNWLTENFPNTTALKDREGRTALHYCAVTKTPQAVWEKLVAAGADPSVVDNRAHDAAYYIEHPQEVELPDTRKLSGAMRRFTSGKDGFVVTRANIRIWIHDRDLGRLQQMLWEGHGDKLRVETSNSPRVKRLLDAVPYIMGTIKDVHKGAVTDDLELFQKRSADPVPANILASKDQNGLNPLHKAAGLGHTNIVQDILARNPKALSMADNDGKLPLHYAAALKDDGQMYNLLVEAGADEQALDNRGKPASYYRHRPGEIDGSLLKVIPDAPRTASVFPPAWDWRLLNSMTYDFGPVPVEADEAGDSESKHGGAGRAALAAGATGALGIAAAANLHRATPTGGQKAAEIMDDEDEGVGEEGEQDDELERQRAQEEADREERERVEREREEAERLEQEEAERQARKEAERQEQEEAERLAAEEHQREEEERLQKQEEERQQQEEEERLQQEEEERQRQEEEERQRQEEEERQRQEEEERQRKEEEERQMQQEEERQRQDEEEKQRQDEEEKQGQEGEEEAERQRQDEDESHRQEEEERQRQEEEEQLRQEDEERLQMEEEEEEERLRGEEVRPQQEAGREGEHPTEAERWVREEEDEEGEQNQEDPQVAEVRQLIAEGNMEQLATMVLNGEGERLVGMKSDDPEIQTFLNNVPSYMAKINTVQAAAREGRLRDLQAALDRRRFAVARENSTPLNVTPLHVAVLFTRADVARYLGGRFPETLNVPDSDNRTPLHYAATLADNGHMYNLLLNLGANPTLKDNRGRTAEYYLTHRDRLTHKKLLNDYGASESIADDTFGDKAVRSQVEPVFWTEEGRYLAASLGDPLIKGLMEVAEVRPADPIAYLAAYLYNFANKNKSRTATQESEVLITTRSEEPPIDHAVTSDPTHSAVHRPLTSPDLDDDDDPRPPSPDDAYSSANRDEHGQSMLHFAAARSHGRNALFQLLQETQINVGYRDELYRTARDVAIQANLPDNIHEIDMWVLYLAANGETQKLTELLLEGYDHITDIEDDEDNSIQNVVEQRKHHETLEFLESIPEFEERRERLHRAIRQADVEEVQELLASQADNLLAISKNMYGRCSLHVAVLCQDEQLTDFISGRYPQTLRVGDNLERTALHYAMGVDKVEALSTILIKAGAKRVLKDLKGRQPSYYFMNKSDILRLQDDEEALKL